MNEEMMNPFEYVYENDHVTGINSNALLTMMLFCEQVIETQPNLAALMVYPKKVEEIKDDKGNLQKVEIEWVEHTPNSFFLTAVDQDGSIPVMTGISLKANQLLYSLTKLHEQNINKGYAKKVEDINDKKVFDTE